MTSKTTIASRNGHRFFLLLLLPLLSLPLYALLLSSCDLNATGPLGATVGGAQDIGYARDLIERGEVPPADYIVAEGLFSEHDIAVPPNDCTDPLCLSLGYARAEGVDDNQHDLFVHVGMTSGLSPDQFVRPDLQLVLVVDKSGSMAGESIAAVRDALRNLAPKLTERDEVMIIEFDDSYDITMGFRAMDAAGRTKFLDVVDDLDDDGGTDIESAMARGYADLAALANPQGKSKRLMLFTDARPNVGRTDQNEFRTLTQRYADEGIGLSAFGVGLDFGQELTYHISRLRGGNFFFLRNADRVREIFDDFELHVTPIVYDLALRIPTPPGARLKSFYGLPDQDSGTAETTLEIPTVFFSRNRGAIVLRYTVDGTGEYAIGEGSDVVGGTIRYVRADANGAEVDRDAKVTHEHPSVASGERFFSHGGTRMAVALTNVYLGLHGACRFYHDDNRTEALALLDRAIAYAEGERVELGAGAEFNEEIALMKKLRENIEGS